MECYNLIKKTDVPQRINWHTDNRSLIAVKIRYILFTTLLDWLSPLNTRLRACLCRFCEIRGALPPRLVGAYNWHLNTDCVFCILY